MVTIAIVMSSLNLVGGGLIVIVLTAVFLVAYASPDTGSRPYCGGARRDRGWIKLTPRSDTGRVRL